MSADCSASPQIDRDFMDAIQVQEERTDFRAEHLDARHHGVHAAFDLALRPITGLFAHASISFLVLSLVTHSKVPATPSLLIMWPRMLMPGSIEPAFESEYLAGRWIDGSLSH